MTYALRHALLKRLQRIGAELAPMSGYDRVAWRSCRTLHGLADCTARWLAGALGSQPGYHGPCDVDTVPYLHDVLVALNRLGILTSQSQGATGGPGGAWRQCAWISGWATPEGLDILTRAVPAGCTLLRRDQNTQDVTVTWQDGQPHTAACLIDPGEAYPGAHRAARRALRQAVQFDVIGPRAGDNSLWYGLLQALPPREEVW